MQLVARFWVDVLSVLNVALVTYGYLLFGGSVSPIIVGMTITQSTMIIATSSVHMNQWSDIDNFLVSVHRLIAYGKSPPLHDVGINLPEKVPLDGNLEFRSVYLQYSPKASVLHNISFEVKSGETVGIVGRTGAGKSSLVSVLFRLYPFHGKVFVDGHDTKQMSVESLRSSMSIVPQHPILFPETVRKNLDPLQVYSDREIWDVLQAVELGSTVANLPSGLDTVVTDETASLSVGQKQLLCLGRALLRRNKIVVLDEATASIDLRTDRTIQSIIRTKFSGCTVLVIAHRLSTVMDADKVLVMDAGTVVEFDHAYTLLENKEGFLYNYVHVHCSEMEEGLRELARKVGRGG